MTTKLAAALNANAPWVLKERIAKLEAEVDRISEKALIHGIEYTKRLSRLKAEIEWLREFVIEARAWAEFDILYYAADPAMLRARIQKCNAALEQEPAADPPTVEGA